MTKFRNSRSRAILKFYGEAHVSSYTIDILKKYLLAKAPTKQGTRKVPTSVKNGFENAASSDYGILDSNQPNHAITYGLVCPDCLVEHCRHCKCEKCSKQGKKALANQANGKVNTVKTRKELGEVIGNVWENPELLIPSNK